MNTILYCVYKVAVKTKTMESFSNLKNIDLILFNYVTIINFNMIINIHIKALINDDQ